MKKINLKEMSTRNKLILGVVTVVLVWFTYIVVISYQQAKVEIACLELVQTSKFNGWDGNIGECFNEFLKNEQWYVEDDENDATYVYVKGSGNNLGNTVDMKFKFYVSESKENFELVTMWINGEEQPDDELDRVLDSIFE